jgi:hypothetical protein
VSTLTIRMPEGKHARLRSLAKARGVSINKLIDELATVAIAQHDSETHFRTLAARGSKMRGCPFWTSSIVRLPENIERARAVHSHRSPNAHFDPVEMCMIQHPGARPASFMTMTR